jgi:DNA repair protein RadC
MKNHKPFIREMPADCLPRERLEEVGEKSLSNQELLAILLRTGAKEHNVMALALEVLNHFEQSAILKKCYIN